MSVAELLPWQAGLWQQLAQRRQHAHAYLLHGPAGIGKRRLAERLAHWLLCQQRDNGQPCGQCKGCLLLAAGSHPDLFTLRPAEDKKAVGVDDVRELIDFIAKTAQLGGHKVVLIAEPAAEEMTLAASNALLKSLEEPSRDSVLLLISDQPSRLLPTIKSRCVQQACPSPTRAQSLAWLRQQLPALNEEEAGELLELSGGSPLRALELSGEVREQRAVLVEGFKKLLKRQITPSQLADSCAEVPLVLLLDWLFEASQAILRYQLTSDEATLGLADLAKVNQYLAGKSPKERILALQEELLAQRQRVLGKSNLNRNLLLEALFGQWASLPGAG